MKSYQGIISLNSSEQNEKMAWYCLEHSEIERFKQLLQDGMALTCDMLTTMMFFGYSDDAIKSILKTANKYDSTVVKWMQHYFTVDELDKILPQYQDQLPKDWPSDEDCIRLKLWETLRNRGREDAIAKFAPEVAEKKEMYRALIQTDFAKYAPIYLKNEWLSYILSAKDGWKYLIDNGKVDFVLTTMNIFRTFDLEQEIVEYCLQKGLHDELYKAEYFDELLEHEKFDLFVKNHSIYGKFLTDHPDKVNWEDLWNEYTDDTSRNYLKERALVNKHLPQCHDFLLAHSSILEQIRLLIS